MLSYFTKIIVRGYLICLINVNVTELKLGLLHCILLSRFLSILFSCIRNYDMNLLGWDKNVLLLSSLLFCFSEMLF